ncbi:MAG TPA: septation protein A [Xanthobacteraceae bacterium]|jgi:intracellular septation protein|nr:septation protein A [Xanthobacteraceae bacterium]
MPPKRKLNPWLKLALDLGPLVVFFAANSRFGIFAGTAIFMVAILVSLAVSYALTRHLAIMPVVSAIIVLVFGSLTLLLHDETFIKVKPTIIYALFGLTLLAGYVLNRPLLAIVFDSVFHLNAEGWRKLTLRWAAFFLVMAVANEIVWRTQTTEVWISFKLFGFTPLTFLFGALQYPLLMKYAAEEAPGDGAPADPPIEKRS